MNPLIRLDLWLLKETHKLSIRTYDLISLHNFALAKIFLVMSGVLEGMSTYITYKLGYPEDAITIFALLWVGVLLCMWRVVRASELSTNSQTPTLAWLVVTYCRLFFYVLALFSILNWLQSATIVVFAQNDRLYVWLIASALSTGSTVTLTLGLYFASYPKPPKKKSRAEETVEKAKEKVRALLQPEPRFAMNARSPRCSGASMLFINSYLFYFSTESSL